MAGSSYVGSCDGKYTGTVAALSNADKQNIRSFTEAQLDAYEAHTGWVCCLVASRALNPFPC